MSAIFPPTGVPPGSTGVCNGYLPHNAVIGEGPLYYGPECTSILTDCAANAVVSEILAAVDGLGFAFNTNRVNNLGEALAAKFTALETALDDKVAKSGDTMTGPLAVPCPPHDDTDAACKFYVDTVLDACCADAQININNAINNFQTELDGKVAKAGDFMTGLLLLSGDPTLPGHAATKNYVDVERDALRTALQVEINDRVRRTGDTMTGDLFLAHDPVQFMEAATKQYVDLHVGGGGTIIISPTVPTAPPESLWWNSATGQLFVHYDDGGSLQWVAITGEAGAGGGNFLPLAGGTLTGSLFLAGAPTANNEAATKHYVDSQIALGGTFVDADADGQIYGRQDNAWVPITVITDGGTY